MVEFSSEDEESVVGIHVAGQSPLDELERSSKSLKVKSKCWSCGISAKASYRKGVQPAQEREVCES